MKDVICSGIKNVLSDDSSEKRNEEKEYFKLLREEDLVKDDSKSIRTAEEPYSGLPQDHHLNLRDIDNYLYASKIEKNRMTCISHDFEDTATAEFENACNLR